MPVKSSRPLISAIATLGLSEASRRGISPSVKRSTIMTTPSGAFGFQVYRRLPPPQRGAQACSSEVYCPATHVVSWEELRQRPERSDTETRELKCPPSRPTAEPRRALGLPAAFEFRRVGASRFRLSTPRSGFGEPRPPRCRCGPSRRPASPLLGSSTLAGGSLRGRARPSCRKRAWWRERIPHGLRFTKGGSCRVRPRPRHPGR